MKITPETIQPRPVQQVESRTDSQHGIAQNNSAAKNPKKGDVVELSAALDQELTGRQEELQAERIEAIKAEVAAGTYQVSSRAVAEKMLSGSSGI